MYYVYIQILGGHSGMYGGMSTGSVLVTRRQDMNGVEPRCGMFIEKAKQVGDGKKT